MNAYEIYKEIVEQSGQVQLTFERTRLYINQGQRWLDLKVPTEKDPSWSFGVLAEGESSIDVERGITVEGVQVLVEGSTVPYELCREDNIMAFIRRYDLESGNLSSPREYAVSTSRAFTASQGHPTGKAIPSTGDRLRVLVGPRAGKSTEVAILGKSYAERLQEKDDTSFWSTLYPDLLILASLYTLECYMRNTEGQKDWLNALEPLVRGLEEVHAERRTGHLTTSDPFGTRATRWEEWQWPGTN